MNLPFKIVQACDNLFIKVHPDWDFNTLIKDVVRDSLEYFELLAELDLDDSKIYLTIGDLVDDNL